MDVSRWQFARLDERVEALDARCRTSKAQGSLRWAREGGDLVKSHDSTEQK